MSKGQMKKESLVHHVEDQSIHPVLSKVFCRRLSAGPTLKHVSRGERGDSMMQGI